jgi:hypothetical protein
MKENFFGRIAFILVFLCVAGTSSGQKFAFNLFGGYTFQDKVNFSSGYGIVQDAAHWGGSVEIAVKDYMFAEILYQRQDTRAELYGPSGYGEGRLGLNYIMIGAVKYTIAGGPISPYGGLAGGIGIFEGKDLSRNSTKFAFGLKAGVLFNVSDAIGIRVQGQMLTPVQGAGGGFYFGTGGTGAAISTYSSIYQFGVTGGIQYKLNAY